MTSVEKMHEAGEANARQRTEMLAKKLDVKKGDLVVSCTYDGIRTADGKLDIDSSAFDNDTLEFQWTLRTGDSEWVDTVKMLCKNLAQGSSRVRSV